MPSSAEKRQENGDYWEDRLKEISEEQHEKADAVIVYIANRFHRAIQLVERDFTHWYNRLAANNGLSYADALKLLSADELDEFHWTVEQYIKIAEEKGLDPEWLKQLENASAKVHIRHLEELEMQMQQYIEELEAEAAEKVEDHLKDVAESTYVDTAKAIEESAPDMSVSFDFDKINPDIVDEVVNKPWASDGDGFSDRLGYDKKRLVDELNKAVAQGLMRGQSPDEIAAELVKQLGISQNNAIRIARTETAAIASKADLKLYKDMGIEEVRFMASLDRKTCAVCSDMDGKVIPLKQCRIGLNMPPLHPNCRCYTVPVTGWEDESDVRQVKNDDGSYTEVPADTSVNDWRKQNSEPIASNPLMSKRTGKSDNKDAAVKETTEKLTDDEESAIYAYLGGACYELNEALRNHEPLTDEQKAWVRNLDSALKKLPKYEGTLLREMDFSDFPDGDERAKAFFDSLELNKARAFDAYTSTTRASSYMANPKVKIYIQNAKNGRYLGAFYNGEKEVLYERGSAFIIKNKVEQDGVYYILMEEA